MCEAFSMKVITASGCKNSCREGLIMNVLKTGEVFKDSKELMSSDWLMSCLPFHQAIDFSVRNVM